MSLDVYLKSDPATTPRKCECCGHTHTCTKSEYVYEANITHNLGKMADDAGIYKHLWRPEEIGVTHAHQLIAPLMEGVALMKSDPARFKAFDSPNGWGLYEHFVPWIERYLAACQEYPLAVIEVSR